MPLAIGAREGTPSENQKRIRLRGGRNDGEQDRADDADVGVGVLSPWIAFVVQSCAHRGSGKRPFLQVHPLQTRRGSPPRQGLLQAWRSPWPQGSWLKIRFSCWFCSFGLKTLVLMFWGIDFRSMRGSFWRLGKYSAKEIIPMFGLSKWAPSCCLLCCLNEIERV